LARIKEFLKESKQHRKIGECAGNKRKEAPGKGVTKWKNCYESIGKWKSVDLEKQLD
jgi:hypothetical protein